MANPFRLKLQGQWHDLPRQTKLAACLYPALVPKEVQNQMVSIAKLEQRDKSLTKRIQAGTERSNNPWGIKRR
jgi:hypothetical protein